MTTRLRALTLALCCIALIAADWPRFRGPNGEGISEDKNVPVEWSATKNVLWVTDIPGKGNSSPIISGDKLFLQTAGKDGSGRALLCLAADSGKELWKYQADGANAHYRRDNSLASSTPATDGERVYALFWDGEGQVLIACDMEGKELWTRKLGGFKSQHGAGHSPVVYDGKVFLNNDQIGKAVVMAFDAKSGKPLWQAERKAYRTCYNSPFMRPTADGKKELIIASTAGMAGYDPDSGEANWKWDWNWPAGKGELRMVGAPALHDGVLFGYTGSGGGDRGVIALRAGKDLPEGKDRLVWQSDDRRGGYPYVPCMLSFGDYLYSIQDGRRPKLACIVPATGKAVWEEELTTTFYSSPVIIDGKVYATDYAGTTFVYAAKPTFELLAKNSLEEEVQASPAVADGRLYLRTASKLYCIGKK